MLGGGGGSHPLQLTTGLVVNSLVITSPTLASERMLLIPKVSILSEQIGGSNIKVYKTGLYSYTLPWSSGIEMNIGYLCTIYVPPGLKGLSI